MKKKKLGLFPKVVIAITLGVVIGLVAPDTLVRAFKTFNVIFAQLLKFVVPLLVLGLVTPSIANLGRNAGKMLLAVMAISYLSTVCAGIFGYGVASNVMHNYLTVGELSGDAVTQKVFEPFINIKIPPVCDVMTALFLSFMFGVGIIMTGAPGLKKAFDEFGGIIKIIIEKVIIPGLPIYIFTMICEMSAKGVIASLLGAGAKIIATGWVLTVIWLVVEYIIAGAIAGKNPFKCLWNMFPAYLTGFSIASSAPCIPVTQECTLKNGVRPEIAGFVVPLCATVHMCGSTIKLAVTAFAISYITGIELPWPLYVNFVLMQAVAAVAAPGVMGGVLLASLGLIESILGFNPEQVALVSALYLALDGYGPASNVTTDGAIALVIDKFFGKKVKA